MRAYEQIATVLRARLADGHLAAGTVLLEGPLAELFGSSRSPVKQALTQLRDEGLLSRFQGRGLVVGDGSAPVRRGPLDPSLLLDRAAEVQRTWAWQRPYEEIERDLVRCCVFGRFRVNEAELAAHYEIGRTVAHDVLVRIQGTGILDKTARAHWVTVPLDERRVTHLYALRELLESAALAEAMPRLPQAWLRDARVRHDAVAARYPAVEPTALARLETDLHVSCLRHAENGELLQALSRTRCIILSGKHLLGRDGVLPAADPFLSEHEAVFAALARQDAPAAAQAMTRHLRSARDKVLHRLDRFRTTATRPAFPFITPARDEPADSVPFDEDIDA